MFELSCKIPAPGMGGWFSRKKRWRGWRIVRQFEAFDAVDLFVDVYLNLVLLSDSGDCVDLLPEIFRDRGTLRIVSGVV